MHTEILSYEDNDSDLEALVAYPVPLYFIVMRGEERMILSAKKLCMARESWVGQKRKILL